MEKDGDNIIFLFHAKTLENVCHGKKNLKLYSTV